MADSKDRPDLGDFAALEPSRRRFLTLLSAAGFTAPVLVVLSPSDARADLSAGRLIDADAHSDANADADADSNADANADPDANANADSDSDSDADPTPTPTPTPGPEDQPDQGQEAPHRAAGAAIPSARPPLAQRSNAVIDRGPGGRAGRRTS